MRTAYSKGELDLMDTYDRLQSTVTGVVLFRKLTVGVQFMSVFFAHVAFSLRFKFQIRTRAALSPSALTLATITQCNSIQWYDVTAENPRELPFGTDPSWSFLEFTPVSLAFMDEHTLVIGDNSRQFFIFGKPGKQAIRNGSLILAMTGFNGTSE